MTRHLLAELLEGLPLVSLLWTQRQDIGPSARYGHALAFDAARNRTVLVGGDGIGTLHRDTWLWDSETWTQVEDIGPSGRARHAIAYDAGRERIVLFGGENTSALADTWEWDGEAWTQVEDTGPSPRAGHAMCFESASGRTLLFGGSTGSDTWAWNGATWTAVNDVGPAPCEGTALASVGTSTFLFGGVDPATTPPTLYRLTWELEGSDWTERQDMGPAHRFGHGMALDITRGRIVLFGGGGVPPATITSGDLFADTWELPVGTSTGPGPGTEPDAALVSFTIEPGTVSSGETFTVTVGLDQPTQQGVDVAIGIDGNQVGALSVPAGQMTNSVLVLVDDLGLPPGTYQWTATLGAVVLAADLTVL